MSPCILLSIICFSTVNPILLYMQLYNLSEPTFSCGGLGNLNKYGFVSL